MRNILTKIGRRMKNTLKSCWPTLLIVFLYLTIFTQVGIASGSMEPYLMTGDRALLINSWPFYQPKRGDVVGFTMGKQIWIKRVIGLPGETVKIEDGLVYIDGELLIEDYIDSSVFTYSGNETEYVIPEGCVFLMGDNRENSYDARYWENHYMPVNRIIGKYWITILHAHKAQAADTADINTAMISEVLESDIVAVNRN